MELGPNIIAPLGANLTAIGSAPQAPTIFRHGRRAGLRYRFAPASSSTALR